MDAPHMHVSPLHTPVMPRECLEYLAVQQDGVYLDATCGLGGHTAAIAQRLTAGFAISFDRDADIYGICTSDSCRALQYICFMLSANNIL